MAAKKQNQRVTIELELPANKVEELKPLIQNGKLKIVLGQKSFVACNAAFVACNSPFTADKKVAFLACNAAFKK